MGKQQDSTIQVRIGDRDYDKPFDPGCAACRSPWLLQIDHQLASGSGYESILGYLRQRKGGNGVTLGALEGHVPHLALPHHQMRTELEEAARGRGQKVEGTGRLASFTDVTESLMQRGYAQLAAGEMEMGPRELIAVMKLKMEIDKLATSALEADAWQEAFAAFFEIAVRHLQGPARDAFLREVYSSEAIANVTGQRHVPQAVLAQGPVNASG